MKLYYSPGTCALSPHIVAHELSLPIKLVKVDLKSKLTENGEDYRKINPNGYVPAVIFEDGKQLTEGPAIVQYLADLRPEHHLAPPQGSFERYRLQQWLNFITSEIHKGFSPLFNPTLPEDAKRVLKSQLISRLDAVADHLATQPYLMGEQFTVADAYLFVTLRWGPSMGIELTRWPVLASYVDKISGRPAVRKAMQEEGLI
ncbi:MAG: glutathione transferase GstA [Methylosarcina sp.]